MFGSNPFGQSSSSPFASQPAFGQSTNASSPFASKPFGSTSPFGTQGGSSLFGSTTTGVFGAQSSSPLGSTSVFGAASSPAFGSSTPAFGASTTSSFVNSSSPFGSTATFGQKPAFGAFGSTSTQASPFGNSFQQPQAAFGSNMFGSSPFGSSQSAFGAQSAPAFGLSSTPGFSATSTPTFGSTTSSPFSSSGGGFGVSNASVFGSVSPGFGISSTPAFGAASTPAFGAASTPAFGTASTPAFGAASTPAFGTASTPAFGASSTTAFGASTAPAFGAPGTGLFGVQPGTPSFGSSGFGQSAFGTQRPGSRVAAYAPTTEVDTGTQPAGKLESISAMPIYKDKSHEELRWEDYQLNDKGGPAPVNPSTGVSGFGSPSTSVFGQSSSNPFSSSSLSNPFAPKTTPFSSPGFGTSVSPAFPSLPAASLTTSNPFGSAASTSSLFSSSTPAFTSTSPSPFGSSSTSAFGSSIFGSSFSQGTSNTFGSGLNFSNSQSSPLFQSSMPSAAPLSTPFGQTMASFGQTAPAFGQINAFSTQSTGFGGNLFASTPSPFSNTVPFGQSTASSSSQFQTAAASAPGGFGSFGQTPAVGTSGFGGTSSIFGQSTFGQPSAIQNTVAVQSAPANPFGTLPMMPQMSIARTGTSPSVQYGISSLPVLEKSVPARVSSYLTSRHLSQRRVRLPVRKYHPNTDAPKVPFFSDGEETPSTPKADAFFVPRENPRALVIRPLEKHQLRFNQDKTILSKSDGVSENGKTEEAKSLPLMKSPGTENKDVTNESGIKEQSQPAEQNQKVNGLHENHPIAKGDSYVTLTSQRAAITFEHGADIETLVPKLRHSDYYTEPRIQELAAKERAEPGYCQHVSDFVVGRHGYGCIKFTGETDVRRLDLESLIQFNDREVIVYMDESKKPPVGQGLNKPAEVTLLNIKCFDKKTGKQCTEGPRIEKYKEMLKRKTEDQGAEFVSYDPVKGEWKFRVYHFSKYKL